MAKEALVINTAHLLEVFESEQCFAGDQKIILYDDLLECRASTQAARELARHSFHRIKDYEEVISGWREHDNAVRATGVQCG